MSDTCPVCGEWVMLKDQSRHFHNGRNGFGIELTKSCCRGIGYHTETCPLNKTGKIVIWGDSLEAPSK